MVPTLQCAEIFDFVCTCFAHENRTKNNSLYYFSKIEEFFCTVLAAQFAQKKHKIQLIFIVLWIYNFGIASGLILISVRVVSVSSKLWRDFAISQSF